jgi:hypothetical protein
MNERQLSITATQISAIHAVEAPRPLRQYCQVRGASAHAVRTRLPSKRL